MANKDFQLNSGLAVTVYKRKRSRNLRLSVTPAGKVRVTIPAWAPYNAGVKFAQSREDWILSQQKTPTLLSAGMPIGKAHHLVFMPADVPRPTSRLTDSSVVVRYPLHLTAADQTVQKAAHDASIRALRRQAEQLLPQRLAILAEQHGFSYNSVVIKKLKGRWGSCDQHKNIVLNLFLMQLSWDLIDYVLLHELTHTQVLRHGPDFWRSIEIVLPSVKARRKQLRDYQPILNSST